MTTRHRSVALAAVILVCLVLPGGGTAAQPGSRTFPETGKAIAGQFFDYWNTHGGLAQFGFPISDEMQERSDLNGRTYTVQYFERAVLEKHPENKPPFDTLLAQVGTLRYHAKYPDGAPGQQANTTGARFFPQTGHTVGGLFRIYWDAHGGLIQQGYPISEEFNEVSPLDSRPYTVQYFERAVLEWHPENPAPFSVLLSQLGTLRYRGLYQTPTVRVRVADFAFTPSTLTVALDTRVTWTNDGPTEHTVVDQGGSFTSDILTQGDSYSHVFRTAGTYNVYCTFHPQMKSTVVVR